MKPIGAIACSLIFFCLSISTPGVIGDVCDYKPRDDCLKTWSCECAWCETSNFCIKSDAACAQKVTQCNGLAAGGIAGIIVGSILGLFIIGCLLNWAYTAKKRRDKAEIAGMPQTKPLERGSPKAPSNYGFTAPAVVLHDNSVDIEKFTAYEISDLVKPEKEDEDENMTTLDGGSLASEDAPYR